MLDEDFPGPAVSSPDEVVRYALDTGAGIYHAVGASGFCCDTGIDLIAESISLDSHDGGSLSPARPWDR